MSKNSSDDTSTSSILMTTVCICGDGQVYDLGKGEYPPFSPHKDGSIRSQKYMVVNAFTCRADSVPKSKKKKKKR